MIKKLNNLISRFLSSQYQWRYPRKSDVLVFDGHNQGLFKEYIGEDKFEVLYTRWELINIPILVLALLERGSIKTNYFKIYISKVAPNLVVTLQDNNLEFYKLKKLGTFKTLFIQNGWRGYYADVFSLLDELQSKGRENDFEVDYMLTFGDYVGDLYAKYLKGKVVPVGAFKNNSAPRIFGHKQIKNSIGFVSQWHPEGFFMGDKFYSHDDFYGNVEKPIFEFLKNYCATNNKTFHIIPRHSVSSELHKLEKGYFKSIWNDDLEFLSYEGDYPAYQALESVEVVLTLDSTLGYEAAARGYKTAFFSIRSYLYDIPGLSFAWPREFAEYGDFWTNLPDQDIYQKILDRLFNIDDEAWKNILIHNDFNKVLKFDPGNKKLIEILNIT